MTRALIVGASGGIGLATAKALKTAGYDVIGVGRRPQSIELKALNVPYQSLDLQSSTDLKSLREHISDIDHWILSAAIVHHQTPGEMSEKLVRAQLETNLVAYLLLLDAYAARGKPDGSMTVLSSTLATRPIESSAAYSASKAGLEAAVRSLAPVAAKRSCRINTLRLGLVDTPMLWQERNDSLSDAQRRQEFCAQVPLSRLAQPEEIADFLKVIIESPYLLGSVLTIDGGLSVVA